MTSRPSGRGVWTFARLLPVLVVLVAGCAGGGSGSGRPAAAPPNAAQEPAGDTATTASGPGSASVVAPGGDAPKPSMMGGTRPSASPAAPVPNPTATSERPGSAVPPPGRTGAVGTGGAPPSTAAATTTPPGVPPATSPPSAVPPGTGKTIRLGGVFPLSGPLGSVGRAHFEGVQAVLTEANQSGGINGAKLDLVAEDDQFDPARGKALVQKLIHEDNVFAFAGIFSPFTTQAALPDIRAAGVPVLPSGSDDREFDEPLLFPVTNPCGRQMAGNVQHAVQQLKRTKLAVVYLNVEAVTNCVRQFAAVARKLGAAVVFQGATAPAAPDCASRIVSARASGADMLIVIVDNLGVVKCVQAKEQQGWGVPVSISYNIVDDPTLIEGLGERAEGLYSSSPFSGAASPAFDQQCGSLRRYYPKAKVQFFTLVGCAGARVLVDALRALGPDATRSAVLGYLESGRSFSLGGLSPDLSWRPGRHLPYDLTASVQIHDGRWVRIGPLYTPVTP